MVPSAVGVIELKNSRVSIGDGIRQNISNWSPEFNEWFYSTVQFLFAGSDSEGLRYPTLSGLPRKEIQRLSGFTTRYLRPAFFREMQSI